MSTQPDEENAQFHQLKSKYSHIRYHRLVLSIASILYAIEIACDAVFIFSWDTNNHRKWNRREKICESTTHSYSTWTECNSLESLVRVGCTQRHTHLSASTKKIPTVQRNDCIIVMRVSIRERVFGFRCSGSLIIAFAPPFKRLSTASIHKKHSNDLYKYAENVPMRFFFSNPILQFLVKRRAALAYRIC